MKLRKVDSKSVILHKGSNVTLKTCGDSREVQFMAGNNTKCPIQNLSKNKYLDKQTDLSDAQKSFQRITIAEPQGEGHGNSWHLHILLLFEDTAPYIENEMIANI